MLLNEKQDKYKYVFVVLTYRNTQDIIDLLGSINEYVNNFKVIVVNSYYDDETAKSIESIATKNDAVFINIENKGYSYGNNRGIEYALNNYEFDWLIIANPDTVIKKFDFSTLDAKLPAVIAPEISNLRNHKQNPMRKSISKLSLKMQYKGFKKNNKRLIYSGILIAKIKDMFTVCKRAEYNKKLKQIDAAHGSFVVFSKYVFDKIGLPYDENIFLFGEEGVLSVRTRAAGIPTYYFKDISVLHKEDGSMKFRGDISDHLAKANLYVCENYFFSEKEKRKLCGDS